MKATLQNIVDLLLAAGYRRAGFSWLSPFDKLTGGLSWCITDSDADFDLDLFYDDDASLAYKIKVGEAIEEALHKMDCPHPLHARQIEGLDYEAVHPVVQWLVDRITSSSVTRQDRELTSSPWHFQNSNLEIDKASSRRSEMPTASILVGSTEKDCSSTPSQSEDVHAAAVPDPNVRDTQSTQDDILLRHITLEEENNKRLQVQRRDVTEKISKLKDCVNQQEKEKRELILKMEKLNKTIEMAGMTSFLQKLLPLLEQNHKFLAESEDWRQEMSKSEVEDTLQTELLRLKLLRENVSEVCRKILLCHKKLEDLPCQAELIQYERCFVEMYLTMQEKLMETRRYYAKYNALAEANDMTVKEISLLNSINAQFEQAAISNEGRRKFVDSMSDIAKGTQQKLAKLQVRLLEKQNDLTTLKEKHQRLVTERRQYVIMVKIFEEECAKNEMLRSASLANRAV